MAVCRAWRATAGNQDLWRAHVKACVRLNTDTTTVDSVKALATKSKSWRQAFASAPRLLHDGFFTLKQQYYRAAYNDLWHKTEEAYLTVIFHRVWWFQPDGSLLYLMLPGDRRTACKALKRGAADASKSAFSAKRLSMMRVHEAFWGSRRGPSARSLVWVMAREDGADKGTLERLAHAFEGRPLPEERPPAPPAAAAEAEPVSLPSLPAAGEESHDDEEELEAWTAEKSIWLGGTLFASPAELGVTTRAGLAAITSAMQTGAGSVVPGVDKGSAPGLLQGGATTAAQSWHALSLAAVRSEPADPGRGGGGEHIVSMPIGLGAGTVSVPSAGAAAGGSGPPQPVRRRGRRGKAADKGVEGVGGASETHISFGVWELHGREVCCTVEVPNTGTGTSTPHVVTWRFALGSSHGGSCNRLTVMEQAVLPATCDREEAKDASRLQRIFAIEGEDATYMPMRAALRS